MKKGLNAMEKEQIEQKAEALLAEINIDSENGVDVIDAAQSLGFVVGTADLDDSEDGFIMVNLSETEILGVPTNRLIVVNQKRDYYEKRFIIAHELAHYDLAGRENIFACRESRHGRTDAENQVDYYAACLLIPSVSFKKQFDKYNNGSAFEVSKELSKIFEVPVESVLRRMDELGLRFND